MDFSAMDDQTISVLYETCDKTDRAYRLLLTEEAAKREFDKNSSFNGLFDYYTFERNPEAFLHLTTDRINSLEKRVEPLKNQLNRAKNALDNKNSWAKYDHQCKILKEALSKIEVDKIVDFGTRVKIKEVNEKLEAVANEMGQADSATKDVYTLPKNLKSLRISEIKELCSNFYNFNEQDRKAILSAGISKCHDYMETQFPYETFMEYCRQNRPDVNMTTLMIRTNHTPIDFDEDDFIEKAKDIYYSYSENGDDGWDAIFTYMKYDYGFHFYRHIAKDLESMMKRFISYIDHFGIACLSETLDALVRERVFIEQNFPILKCNTSATSAITNASQYAVNETPLFNFLGTICKGLSKIIATLTENEFQFYDKIMNEAAKRGEYDEFFKTLNSFFTSLSAMKVDYSECKRKAKNNPSIAEEVNHKAQNVVAWMAMAKMNVGEIEPDEIKNVYEFGYIFDIYYPLLDKLHSIMASRLDFSDNYSMSLFFSRAMHTYEHNHIGSQGKGCFQKFVPFIKNTRKDFVAILKYYNEDELHCPNTIEMYAELAKKYAKEFGTI